MEYTTETLDRSTGELVERSLGNFVTVTELGALYGKGPKEIRLVLHHMGLLGPEGAHGSYRLTPFAVAAGLGKRIKPKRSRFPFDTLSPKAQALIADSWADVVRDLEQEAKAAPKADFAKADLAAFCADRNRSLSTQQAVSWLRYFHRDLTHRQMAKILDVSEQLVGQYAGRARKQLNDLRLPKGLRLL